MADSGEWKCFHDINRESQRALAEMNETLGSLREWQKQRKGDSLSSSLACTTDVEDTSMTSVAGQQLLSQATPSLNPKPPSQTTVMPMVDKADGSFCEDSNNNNNNHSVFDVDERDPLLVLWQVREKGAIKLLPTLRPMFVLYKE